MNAATIAAVFTAIPAILGAITALVIALRSSGKANTANAVAASAKTLVTDHVIERHPVTVVPMGEPLNREVTVMSEPTAEQAEAPEAPEAPAFDGAALMGIKPPVTAAAPSPVQPVEAPVAPVEAPVAPTGGDPVASARQALTDAGNALLKIAESL